MRTKTVQCLASPGMPALRFEEFTLENAAFELRYAHKPILWDCMGTIAEQADHELDNIQYSQDMSEGLDLRHDMRYTLKVRPDRMNVIDHDPTNEKDVAEVSDSFFQIVRANLNIDTINRIGVRLRYRNEYDNLEEASSALLDAPIISVPQLPMFNTEAGTLVNPTCQFQVHGDTHGFNCRMLAQSRQVSTTPDLNAYQFGYEFQEYEQHVVLLDIDHFTTKPASVESIHVEDLISSSFHVIRRDLSKLLS